ncbi:RsmB/NOP family class I SAM-dependent RNA methyltransferase [Allobranchiibius sp. CTAmp26]|uniref:RsmB/NOP family class I SAM-dependent RNA methyltransferase n=1 Tax=Allobranchiibius sp. CTAmp26 TaxID=2815214 RepID=UPI001AA10F32|nr:transcription antitermination factor NusB [Allobranchiibius sp. CTAmp26]MBO1754303.1 rRNA small subunit methyltransferase B [Allobranchiibius sp. CTAmp26]
MSDDGGGYRDAKGRQRPAARRRPNDGRSAQRPTDRRRSGDPARRVAWQVTRNVADGAYANLDLQKLLREADLHGRDAGFATELTYGAIRMRGLYDPILERCAGRTAAQIDAPVLDTLRLGAHQLLGMRVPSHAAASETVALAREVNGAGAAGFVNAVLRRVSERTREEWVAEVTAGREPLERLAIEHSHPIWVVRAMRAALLERGTATAEDIDEQLLALLQADNAPPLVSLVARPGLSTVEELVAAGAHASQLSRVGAVLDGGDPAQIDAVRRMRAAVQDEGSQLLTLALAEPGLVGGREHQEWLDLCAGPGGKTALLANLGAQQGAVVFANEVSEHRTTLVRKSLRATLEAGIEVMIGTGDGRDLGAEEPDTYERVLADVPCTGLGALRRRPEARWRRTPADVTPLVTLQRELLLSAIATTRPGGVVGYSTCSPHLAETSQLVASVVEQTGVRLDDARPLFRDTAGAPIEHLGNGPDVQLWPHLHGTDAMYFALLRKPDTQD